MSLMVQAKKAVKKLIYPKRICSICRYTFHGRFYPLSPYYLEHGTRYGYPYKFDDAETLNYKEYTCPSCGAMDRERLYALYIDKTIQPQNQYKLLDIAPSNALQKYLKSKPNISYRCADLFMEDVDDKGLDLMDMNIYADSSFDIFICSHVLEHVPDDRKAMRELYRILKPGGFGIAMVPIVLAVQEIDEDITVTDPGERWRRFGQDDHVRLYSKQGFLERLTEAGFKVVQYSMTDFGVKHFNLHGISAKSVLYIVRK